jgi:4-amino-4-deoxy-L-arabinose transferase-like glycosyltransferase
MSVRVWLALALALAVVIVWLTVNQIAAGAAERELIFNGIPVDAVITQIGNISDPRLASRRIEPLVVKVRYLLPGESQERIVGGSLSRLNDPSVLVHPGDHVPLRIDPKIPWIWTDRTQPQSWLLQLSVALILLPVLLVLLVIAWLTRERVLRIWQHGELSAGIVVDVRQIAIAPRSRQVRFTLADRSSARVFSVLIPIKAGLPRPGEQIWLIQPRGLPQHALPAKMYL